MSNDNATMASLERTYIMRWFDYQHLPPHLQAISRPIANLATEMDALLPTGAEKIAGLRKLLEAKDCLVRSAIEMHTDLNRQAPTEKD